MEFVGDQTPGFHIAYELKESPGRGLGLFTLQFIPKGTLIWKYCRGVNVASYKGYEDARRRLDELSVPDQQFWVSHIYLFDGFCNEILDDGKYMNHGEHFNTDYGCGSDADWHSSYAVRDIQIGEELLEDYGKFEYPDWYVQLAKDYDVPLHFVTIKESMKPGFHVDYEVKESPGMGLGLFTKEFIPKNKLIWKYAPGCNVRCFNAEETKEYINTLNKEDREFWLSHVYLDNDCVNEILDDAKYWNHSEDSNTCSGYLGDWTNTYAKRDIQADEELLEDYGRWQYPDWMMKIFEEYNIPNDFFVIKVADAEQTRSLAESH